MTNSPQFIGNNAHSGISSFVTNELTLIRAALVDLPESAPQHAALYAAQQALHWTLDPENYASPLTMIQRARA